MKLNEKLDNVRELKEFIELAKEKDYIKEIYLYGSFLNKTTYNDIDILIVYTSNNNVLNEEYWLEIIREYSKDILLDVKFTPEKEIIPEFVITITKYGIDEFTFVGKGFFDEIEEVYSRKSE